MKKFKLTKDHIKLLQRANIQWWDCEYGAPGLDPKRPYGNSDVLADMYEILHGKPWDYEKKEEMSDKLEAQLDCLHLELQTALQIVLTCRTFQPGTFFKEDDYSTDWQRIK